MSGSNQRWTPLLLLGLLVLAAIPVLRGLGDDAISYSDADRILMDGVFVHDFLRAFPIDRPMDWAYEYYGRYPALSIGYRPPLLPVVEAAFFFLFGIETWAARLAVVFMWLIGVAAFFALARRTFDAVTATAACALLVTNPFLVQWGWYTMAELPALGVALLAGLSFQRYLDESRPPDLYLAVALTGLAAWTKPTAACLGLWFVPMALLRGQAHRMLVRRETWIGAAFLVALLYPIWWMLTSLGAMNIDQSIGSDGLGSSIDLLGRDNLTLHLNTLVDAHASWPLLALATTGVIVTAVRRERGALTWITLIVGTYVFFTAMVAKESRYPIFWLPGLCAFAGRPLGITTGWRRYALGAGVATLVVSQLACVYEQPPNSATGYDEAAQWVLDHSPSPVVFFDGHNNGYFTFFMRKLDPDAGRVVLRGDKLLTSAAVLPSIWSQVHAETPQDIIDLLDGYGVAHVVVEQADRQEQASHATLRSLLDDGPFLLEKQIRVKNVRRGPLAGESLRIYRYLDAKPLTRDRLRLHLPIIGKTLDVPVRPGGSPR